MKRLIFAFLIVLLQTYNTSGYEVATQEQLSREAVDISILTNSAFQSQLGLKPPRDPSQTFLNFKPSDGPRTVIELVQDGSKYEDDGFRAREHFFNPLNGYALFNVPGFVPSPDWTLEDKGDISGQDDSFKDTRRFFFEALTPPSETERKARWGRTFQGLGQVIHHLQDMAQPEHSRVDPHLVYTPEGLPSGLGFPNPLLSFSVAFLRPNFLSTEKARRRLQGGGNVHDLYPQPSLRDEKG